MIKVFIVEDDPMVLDVNIGFLEKIPLFQLCGTALNSSQAIESIEEKKPDLVLLDMFLPDGSGLEVLSWIRMNQVHCDVIMITAARDATTIHEVFRLGAVDYLVKPFRFNRFKTALETYQKMWKKLSDVSILNQEDIDELKQVSLQKVGLPKGLSETTLRQILMNLMEQSEPVTAEQLASYLGMARVTVRRYLDYLEQSGQIRVQIQYGNVGRPSHYYYV
ncbi:response regulator [Halalkalibacter urbisdiaboli]|uniref:response regulator n=1 Tax=Halalkalibacter urbisdiaboli TaxID=1960589 RepID=UPI000B4394B0|nr:response regulator [Halalkalibacter urbisdiaboli]